MNFGNAIKSCFGNYATFQGRASRSEFWFFFLFIIILIVGAMIIDSSTQGSPIGLFYVVSVLGTFLPQLSVTVRRLHDTDHSGWWYWFFLVPFIGLIVLLIFFCTKGTDGTNDFGADPLNESHSTRAFGLEPQQMIRSGQGTPASNNSSSNTTDAADQLAKLHKLRETGALTDSEYADQKSKVIRGI